MDQLTFTDIFNKSLLSIAAGSADKLTPLDIIVNLSMSFAVGMFIFFIYKKTFQGVLYHRSFNISLVMVSTVTSLVIMTISGNLILSLGMVGALSIVRFRTPVKDSIDLVFLFWAISVGIANGVSYYNISIIGSIIISLALLSLTKLKESDQPYLLITQLPPGASEQELFDYIKKETTKSFLKSKVVTEEHTEIILEIRLKQASSAFINNLQTQYSTIKTTLISYSGDYTAQ